MHKCSLRKKVHDLWGCTWERRQEKSPGWGVCIERKAGLSGGSVGKKSACYAGDQVGSQGAETDDPPLGECLLQPLSEISKIGPVVYPHLREPCCVRMHSCLWLCVAIYVSISLECNYQQMDGMFMLAI